VNQICNVCDNRLVTRFSKVIDPITLEVFAICKCINCGLGHTLPQPKEISRYYGTVYYGNRHSHTSAYCSKRRLGFLSTLINQEDGKKLLDIGCGDGSFLMAARDAGFKVVGTEMNPDLPRSLGLDVKEEIEELSDCEHFDFITMWHSLEHMRDVRYTLFQLSRRLKPKGKLLIAVPDNGGLQSVFFRNKWLHLDVPRHLYHFDIKSLSVCLERTGFSMKYQWHQELEYDLMGWSQSALNCLCPVPNVFFDYLTGKNRNHSALVKISNILLGAILSALFLPAIPASTLLNRGGTLVVIAQRSV